MKPFLLLYTLSSLCCGLLVPPAILAESTAETDVVRVFIFAGQSNMVGSDSKVDDIQRFAPYAGLEKPQRHIRFSYSIGRESRHESEGWVALQPVNRGFGPELSFGKRVAAATGATIAIIKCAAGGTDLGADWNPDEPGGLRMYPRALKRVRDALAVLDRKNIPYRLEGFLWHQGENDMFTESYMADYGDNLKRFLKQWRKDLKAPGLTFYIGELCTNTIWGMDLRSRMYAISLGQRAVTDIDPLAEYIRTSHIAVEIGSEVGLHYHYGTLGQLELGDNYAAAYLAGIKKAQPADRSIDPWPYPGGSHVRLFVLAGHRNMEGERAFVEELQTQPGGVHLGQPDVGIAYRYSTGGGYHVSNGWEPMMPSGRYDTFGPELSFAATLSRKRSGNIAIAKFTHSGSQLIDWTPEGSSARTRHIYPRFIAFIKTALKDLTEKGHTVELAGIFYHLSENDMSFGPYRRRAATRLESTIMATRRDLGLDQLKWYVSQQAPTDHEDLNRIDVLGAIAERAAADVNLIHLKVLELPGREEKLVITTEGIIRLGEIIAQRYLQDHGAPRVP